MTGGSVGPAFASTILTSITFFIVDMQRLYLMEAQPKE